MNHSEAIESAKVEFSAVYKISTEVFTQVASEILNVPINLIQVRRCILATENFGKLYVFVFNSPENQEYYNLKKGEVCYKHLPSNIDLFTKELMKLKPANYV